MRRILASAMIVCLLVGTLAGCKTTTDTQESATAEVTEVVEEQPEGTEVPETEAETAGEESSGDKVLRFLPDEKPNAKDDLYGYVNYDTLMATEIPSGESSWSYSSDLAYEIRDNMTAIIQDCVKNKAEHQAGSSEQKIAALYECVLDNEGRNETALEPLQDYLDAINQAESVDAYLEALGGIWKDVGAGSVFRPMVNPDDMDSSKNAVFINNVSVGLDKDYYVNESMSEYLEIYQTYMKKIWMSYGLSDAEAQQKADEVFQFQKTMAETSLDATDYYKPEKYYNPTSVDELQKILPSIDAQHF